MKSWTHPETRDRPLLCGRGDQHGHPASDRSTDWTFEVAAFPIFILCMASVEVVLVGLRARPSPGAGARNPSSIVGPDAGVRATGAGFARLVGNGGEVVRRESLVPTAHANGIDIEYLTEGDPSDPPICSSSWAWGPS